MAIALKLLTGTVIVVLRLMRALCGLGVLFTGFTLIFLLTGIVPMPDKPTSLNGLVLIAVGLLAGLFLGLGWLINRIHRGVHGTRHPVVSRRNWSL